MLHLVSGGGENAIADVVFIHGLAPLGELNANHAFTTWGGESAQSDFWPKWLGDDLRSAGLNVAVHILEYDASASKWFGHSMSLADRSSSVINDLWSEGLGSRPIVFVAHSLGGLVVKQVLRRSATNGNKNEEFVAKQTVGVVFFSTPHTGSGIATYLDRGPKFFRLGESIKDLTTNASHVRDLAMWFSNNIKSLQIDVRTYYETKPTNRFVIVDAESANPNAANNEIIAVDSDHSGISRLLSRDATYKGTLRFLKEVLKDRLYSAFDKDKTNVDHETSLSIRVKHAAHDQAHEFPLLYQPTNEEKIGKKMVVIEKCLKAFRKHERGVNDIEYSADARLLVSASDDHTVRIWDTDSWVCVTVLRGHSDYVWGVTFAPDGGSLYSASRDKSVRVWSLSDYKVKRTLDEHVGGLNAVVYSNRGAWIASSSWDKSIIVREASTHKVINTLEEHRGAVYGLAFSPADDSLASSSWDKCVRIWNTDTWECDAMLEGHNGIVFDVAYSSDGKSLASASQDGVVRIWDTASNQCLETLSVGSDAWSVAYSPDNAYLVSAHSDKTIRVWEGTSYQQVATLLGHTDEVICLAFSSTGQLASGANNGEIRIWDLSSLKNSS